MPGPVEVPTDLAGVRCPQAGDHPQQRRFAAAARADDPLDLTMPDVEVQARDHRLVRSIMESNIGQFHHGGGAGRRLIVGAVLPHHLTLSVITSACPSPEGSAAADCGVRVAHVDEVAVLRG